MAKSNRLFKRGGFVAQSDSSNTRKAYKLIVSIILSITLASSFDLAAFSDAAIALASKKVPDIVKIKKIVKKKKARKKKVVCIDPGHSSRTSGGSERIGPGSRRFKAKDNTGTSGRFTHVKEYVVTMSVAKKLKKELENREYKVVLTRADNKHAVSCKKRALIANKAKADIFLRLHCDGVGNSRIHGISMQSPGKAYAYPRKNRKKIVRLSKRILKETCKATGAHSKGIFYRNDLTGNNWAKMPVTLIEMGFMSNYYEDHKLVTRRYQLKLVKGMANGIDAYFGISRKKASSKKVSSKKVSSKNKSTSKNASSSKKDASKDTASSKTYTLQPIDLRGN